MAYCPHTPQQVHAMLERLGLASVDELFRDVPERLQETAALSLPPGKSELEVVRELRRLAATNLDLDSAPCFLGAGCYDHYIPAVVNAVTSRGEFYTAYTPYQPEVSQGTLQVIFEFQTLVAELLEMDLANASLYDGASALAESVLLSLSVGKARRVLLPATLHPHYRSVVVTHLGAMDVEVVDVPFDDSGVTDLAALERAAAEKAAAVVVQHPNFFGRLETTASFREAADRCDALLIAAVDPISVALLSPPGAWGADIAVAEGQPLGLPPSLGGPSLGLFACSERLARRAPGRLVGATVDARGKRGFVLTLQTREQHIRRERATSNICTNQGLCALAATVYLTAMGPCGLRQAAEQCAQKARYAAATLSAVDGFELRFPSPFFQEFVFRCPRDPEELFGDLARRGVIGGLPLGRFHEALRDCMMFAVTETRTRDEIDGLVETLVSLTN